MAAIYLLIIVSFVVAAGFLVAFIWSLKSGQYEDDYAPSMRIFNQNKKTETPKNDQYGA